MTIFFTLLVAFNLAYAQEDVTYGRATAMGRAAAANPMDNSSLSLNPAAMALSDHYDFEFVGRVWNGSDYQIAVSAVDNRTAPIAFGLQYQRLNNAPVLSDSQLPAWRDATQTDPYRRRYDTITLALAYSAFDNLFSIGANGSIAFLNHDSIDHSITGNIDIGLGTRPLPWLAITVAGQNLLPIQGQPDFNEQGLLCGIWLGKPGFGQFSADVEWQITGSEPMPVSFRVGAEKNINIVHIGAGYRYEGPTSEQYLSLGVGVYKTVGITYGVELPLHESITWSGVVHSFGLRVTPPEKKEDKD